MKELIWHAFFQFIYLLIPMILGLGTINLMNRKAYKDPDPHSGIYDGLVYAIVGGIIFIIWTVYMLSQIIMLHKAGMHNKRNASILLFIFMIVLPVYIFLK